MPFNRFLGSSTQRRSEGPKPPVHDDTEERQQPRNRKQDHSSVLRRKADAGKTTNSVDAEGLSAINPFSSPPKESDSTAATLQPITHVTHSDQRQSLSERFHKQPESSSLAHERTKDKGDKRQRHYQEPITEESSYHLDVHNETLEHSAIVSPNKPPECLAKQPRPGLRREGNLWSWIPHLRQSVDDKNMVANVREVFVLAEQYVNNHYVNRPYQELPEDFPPELKEMSFPHLFPYTPITDLLRQVHRQDTVIKHCLVSIILSTISLDCDNSYPSLLPLEFTQLPKALRQSTATERKIPHLQAALSAHRVLSHYIRPNVTDDRSYLRQRNDAIETVTITIEAAFRHWQNGNRSPDQRISILMSLLRRAADLGILLSTQASTFLFDWKMQPVQSNDIEIPIWPRMLKVYDEEARELDPAQHMSRMKTEFASFISDVKPSKEHDKPLTRAVTEAVPVTQPTAITEYRPNFAVAPILQNPLDWDAIRYYAETGPYDQQAQKAMSSSHGVHKYNVLSRNSVGHTYQEADFKIPHYMSDPDSALLRSQYGIVMHELRTRTAAGIHENLPILVSEQGEDRNMPNGSQGTSTNAATTCYEMPGDATKHESLPREPAELEDAALSVRPKISNAAEKPTASPERHHQDKHQGSESPAKHKIREPVELANSVQGVETEPKDHARRFPGSSQQYATNSIHTAYQKPVSERPPTHPPSSYPSALPNGQSRGPPLARSPSLNERSLPRPCITDGAEGQQDLQQCHHHSPSRSHARSGDHQCTHERRSMDTYPRSLPPDVHVSCQRGLGVDPNRQDSEAYGRSLVNKTLRGSRPSSSSGPASSTASFRTRQNSTKPTKPTAQWRAFFRRQ